MKYFLNPHNFGVKMRKKNRPYTHIGMDDFQPSNLYQSRDEVCARLVGLLTPLIIEGIKSIFNEAVKMCVDNQEVDKYLMHFQNLISHIPIWNLGFQHQDSLIFYKPKILIPCKK